MEAYLNNPAFWVGLAFFIFIALVIKPLAKIIPAALDKRAREIAEELERAQALREEAQLVLAQYQKKQRESLQEAEEIIQKANQEARRITKEAEADLEESMQKRMKLAMDKIAQAERQALQEVQNHLIDITVAAARHLIQEGSTTASQEAMVRQATQDLQKKLL